MKLKQFTLSLCLECIDIRLGVYSIYTIINNEVVYFEAAVMAAKAEKLAKLSVWSNINGSTTN